MGAPKRQQNTGLVEHLLRESPDFEFFRAVQVLERHVNAVRRSERRHVGEDARLEDLGLCFQTEASLSFPPRALRSVKLVESETNQDPIYRLVVSFLGLIGPAGVLPAHYTEMVIARLHQKDSSLSDFNNLIQERSVELFYRAWKKYRVPVSFPRTRRDRGLLDPVLNSLMALVGLPGEQRGRPVPAERLAFVYHSGLFADRRRSSSGLRAMMSGLLGCPVRVEQFVGEWVDLDRGAQCRLGEGPGEGASVQLGDVSVLGARVWCVDARVRIVAGPLERDQFRELWPGGEAVRNLRAIVTEYLGPLIEYDLEWELAEDAPEPLMLGGDQRLGRDGWLGWGEFGGPDTRVGSPAWHNADREEVLVPSANPA